MNIHFVSRACLGVAALLIASCASVGNGGSSETQQSAPAADYSSSSDAGYHQESILSRTRARVPESRPGLGTGWGREVDSRMNYTNFRRQHSQRPAAKAEIYYNDKDGMSAILGHSKWETSGSQQVPGGLVEWGVKGLFGYYKNYTSSQIHIMEERQEPHMMIHPYSPRRYIVGKKGRRYSLVVKNRSHSRLEVVLSVDGLDVMDGGRASYRKRGYIIAPGETLEVKGFRTSTDSVASFKFSGVDHSYSNQRHGSTRNVGVIGLAVFTQEGISPWKWSSEEIRRRQSASPFATAP